MRYKTAGVITLVIMLVLSGCSSLSPTVPPTEELNPTTTPVPPSPPPATHTSSPPAVVLLASADADQELLDEVSSFVSVWAKDEGFRFQRLEKFSVQDVSEEDFRLVVALPPQPELDSIVQAAPDIPFLAVGFSGLAKSENLFVILPGKVDYDHHGFLAGYLAASVSPEWRVGAIGVTGSEYAEEAWEAYVLGVRYFCGLCQPDYPPYEYPLVVTLSPGASSSEWQASADVLIKKGVETFYVVPGAGDERLIQFLVDSNTRLITDGRYYSGDLQESWVASLKFDLLETMKTSWPEYVAGELEDEIRVSLKIEDVNPEILSPGRLRDAESVLKEVERGWIQTTTD
ncbi:MAG: hypothetical protein R6U51_02320 [Anaerolineales bacterium]